MDDTFWVPDSSFFFFLINLVDQSETPIGAQKVSPTPPRTQ
jgi:hypothetical protein